MEIKPPYDMAKIRATHKAADGHFFDRASMRFFSSRVLPYVYTGPGGVFFVTSEQNNHRHLDGSTTPWPRRFTVRKFDPLTGDIDTVGPFNELHKDDAREAAKNYARGTNDNKQAKP